MTAEQYRRAINAAALAGFHFLASALWALMRYDYPHERDCLP